MQDTANERIKHCCQVLCISITGHNAKTDKQEYALNEVQFAPFIRSKNMSMCD